MTASFVRCLFALALLVLGVIPAGSTDDAPPYLYYYSNFLDAFVIERADGSDSRTFNTDISVSRHAFSPSGRWLAWSGSGVQATPVWIVPLDNLSAVAPMQVSDRVFTLAFSWSPIEDVLLTVYLEPANRTPELRIGLYLTDMTTGEQISVPFELRDGYIDFTSAHWFPDGSAVVLSLSPGEDYVVTRTGQVQANRYRFQKIYARPNPTTLAYADDSGDIVIENLATDTIRRVEVPGEGSPAYVDWNPAGDTAMLYISIPCSDDACSSGDRPLWLLDADGLHNTGVQWSNDMLLFEPPFSVNYYEALSLPLFRETWSPDGRYYVIDRGRYIDIANHSVKTISIPNYHSIVQWGWSLDGNLLLTDDGSQNPIFRHDPETGQTTALFYDNSDIKPTPARKYLYSLAPSPNGPWVGLIAVRQGHLVNLDTGEMIPYAPHSASTYREYGVEDYRWHESNEWVLTVEDSQAVTVMNTDGTLRRELTQCGTGCAGWLPERAIAYLTLGNPESVVPDPAFKLLLGEEIRGLAWSDGGLAVATHAAVTIWRKVGSEWQTTVQIGTRLCLTHYYCELSWDPTGRLLALRLNGVVQILDIETGRPIALMDNLSFSWETDDNESRDKTLIRRIQEANAWRDEVKLSSDKRFAAIISPYRFTELWDTDAVEIIRRFNIYSVDAAFSPDGRWLATAQSHYVALWPVPEF